MFRRPLSLFASFSLAIFISLILFGCSSSNQSTTAKLESLAISPLENAFPKGVSLQMSATAFFDDGSKQDVTQLANWSSSDSTVSSIDENGLLSTLSPGNNTISASYQTFSAQKPITIKEATLSSLNINPANPSVAKNTNVKLNVIGIFSDGSTRDVSEQVAWEIENSALLKQVKNNVFQGLETGQSQLTAKLNNISRDTRVEIKPGELTNIQIAIDTEQVFVGDEIPLTAIGVFAEGYKQDISDQVNWTLSDETILSIDSTEDIIAAIQDGNVSITATLDNIEASETISVTSQEATLQDLTLVTNDATVSVGESLQFQAIGQYSDGTQLDLTSIVVWSSDNSNLLAVSNNIGDTGNALALQAGSATISAGIAGLNVSTPITISPATLTAIEIFAEQSSLPLGTSQALRATGIYSDNSKRDITDLVTWQSQNPAIVHVSNETNTRGTTTALAKGESNITASLDTINASISITANDATLVSINIENENTVIHSGLSSRFTAIGSFSDGSQQNISHLVVWNSSNTAVINISNDTQNPGRFDALSAGSATISATYANITKSISIDTVATNLERIIIAPGTTSLTTGATLALRATAIFSDNTSTDITNLGRWTSDNLAVLSVSNGGDKQGIVSAIDEGNATIQISYLDVSSQIGLSVSPATLRSISISPQNISLPGNTELDLTATGIYSDGQSRDITQAVLWSSDAPEIASISNTVGKSGNLRAVTTGTTTISASLADLSSSILIEVTDDTIKGLNILFTGESNLAANSQRLLSAIGNYASGATQDLTQQVKWQTSNSEICTISSAATAETAGILTTLASGLCVATASFGEVSSTVLLTVSTAKLEAITLSPTEISLAKGNQQALTVIGQYSDASTQDLTGQVSWQYSSNVSIDKNGILKALSAGNSTIQASLQGFSDEINVEISSASLENIRISPDPLVINEGTSAQLQATGFYSDDSSQDITHTVTWESTDERVASVSNATDYAGRIDALSTGNTSISAKLDGVLATLNATVELNPTAPKSLALSATPYVIRNNGTDQSTISINVLATDNSTLVADGTRINLSIINGSATLDKNFATINAGKAEFSLTSTTKALITIKATVEGTDISNYVSVYSTDNFAEIIAKGVLLQAKVIDDIIQPGSIFGLAIANYANRSFNLNAFKLGTENNLIYSTTAPEDLNNNVLGAGQYILRGWVTEQERENSFWVAYFLQDPVTGVEFNVGIVFTLPSNN